MLVGEIGLDRHQFLYEVKVWEVRRIIKGYRKRDRLILQMLAECSFNAAFAMRNPEGKTARNFYPFLFEDDEDDLSGVEISDEEVAELQELMRNTTF